MCLHARLCWQKKKKKVAPKENGKFVKGLIGGEKFVGEESNGEWVKSEGAKTIPSYGGLSIGWIFQKISFFVTHLEDNHHHNRQDNIHTQ